MRTVFATRLRRRQRNRQKILNSIALLVMVCLPIYPAFGNYIQDYTGAIVRWDYDASTIISIYDPESGDYMVNAILDATQTGENLTEGADGSSETQDLEPVPQNLIVTQDNLPKEDPKKILYPIHTVTPKQTLEGIAKIYSISVEDIKKSNPWITPDLKIDQKIVIPKIQWVEYIVKKWDVLSVIAARYGINNIYHILVANNLTNASKIRIGQKLFLPNPTKDPNPKKTPNTQKPPLANTQKTPPPPKKSNQANSAPRTISYGSYSLQLKVEKGCRNFAWWNCTCFVAKYKNVTWRWNAKQWLKNAQKAGAPTGKDPRPGAIIVYDGPGYSPYYGHVGIVMEVWEEHIIVKDMNYSALNQITTRRENYRNNSAIKGYIYVD